MTPVGSLGRRTLAGRFVTLEPLEARHHGALLQAAADPETWTYIPIDPHEGFAARLPWMVKENVDGRLITFIVRRLADGAIAGSTSYLNIAPADARVEIGFTWYTAEARGTAVNPEAKFLLLENAFGAHYNRIEFKTPGIPGLARHCASSAPRRKEFCAVTCGCHRVTSAIRPISRFWPANGRKSATRSGNAWLHTSRRLPRYSAVGGRNLRAFSFVFPAPMFRP